MRRTAKDGLFASRGMPPLRGRGKKPAKPLREGDRGSCRPSGLISPFEVAWDAAQSMRTESTVATGIKHRKHEAQSVEHNLTHAHERSRKPNDDRFWRPVLRLAPVTRALP